MELPGHWESPQARVLYYFLWNLVVMLVHNFFFDRFVNSVRNMMLVPFGKLAFEPRLNVNIFSPIGVT